MWCRKAPPGIVALRRLQAQAREWPFSNAGLSRRPRGSTRAMRRDGVATQAAFDLELLGSLPIPLPYRVVSSLAPREQLDTVQEKCGLVLCYLSRNTEVASCEFAVLDGGLLDLTKHPAKLVIVAHLRVEPTPNRAEATPHLRPALSRTQPRVLASRREAREARLLSHSHRDGRVRQCH